jgi:hypothetical protein
MLLISAYSLHCIQLKIELLFACTTRIHNSWSYVGITGVTFSANSMLLIATGRSNTPLLLQQTVSIKLCPTYCVPHPNNSLSLVCLSRSTLSSSIKHSTEFFASTNVSSEAFRGTSASSTEAVVENAAGALMSLTINVENREHLQAIGGLPRLVCPPNGGSDHHLWSRGERGLVWFGWDDLWQIRCIMGIQRQCNTAEDRGS